MNNHLAALSLVSAPRVGTPQIYARFFDEVNLSVSLRTVTNYLKKWEEQNIVQKVAFGVFLNKCAVPHPLPDEAAGFIRNKAVVSLQRVLGNEGVLNNPSHWITCVLPYGSGIKEGMIKSGVTTFHFSKIHPTLLPSFKDSWFSDAFDTKAQYLKATPEKALLDWVYLASTKNQHTRPLPPKHDIEWDMLDQDRLHRLAYHMKLESEVALFAKSVEFSY